MNKKTDLHDSPFTEAYGDTKPAPEGSEGDTKPKPVIFQHTLKHGDIVKTVTLPFQLKQGSEYPSPDGKLYTVISGY